MVLLIKDKLYTLDSQIESTNFAGHSCYPPYVYLQKRLELFLERLHNKVEVQYV